MPATSAHMATTKSRKAPAKAGIVTDGIRMNLVDYAPKTLVGESIDVRVTLTNERSSNVGIREIGPLGGFFPIVRNAKGIRLKPNADGRSFMLLSDRTKIQLIPGQQSDESIELSQIFDMRKAGKYTVTVTHDIDTRDSLKEETAASNTVVVDVATSWKSKS